MKIRHKFLVPSTIAMSVLGFGIYFIAVWIFDRSVDNEVLHRHQMLTSSIERETELLGKQALQLSAVLGRLPVVQQAYQMAMQGNMDLENDPQVQQARERLRKDLAQYEADYRKLTGEKHLMVHFHLNNHRSFLRLWRKKQELRQGRWVDISDDLSSFRQTVVRVNETKKPITGVELGRGGFIIRGVAPLFDDRGEFIGSVEVLHSYQDVLHRVLDPEKTRYALLMDASFLPITTVFHKANLPRIAGASRQYLPVYPATGEALNGLSDPALLDQGWQRPVSTWQGESFSTITPVRDFSGRRIGLVALATNERDMLLARDRFRVYVAGVTVSLLLVLALVLTALGRRAYRPMKLMMLRMEDIADGEGDLSSRLVVESRDEVGAFARLFNRFVEKLQHSFSDMSQATSDILQKVDNISAPAGGVQTEPLSQATPTQDREVRSIAEAKRRMDHIVEKVDEAVRQRRRIEQAQQRLVTIVESSADAIWSVDQDGIIRNWNRGATNLYGYEAGTVWGQSLALLFPDEPTTEAKAILHAVREGRPYKKLDTTRKDRQGKPFPVSVSVSPIFDPLGQPNGAAIIERDIRHRKDLEKKAEERRQQLFQADKLASLGTLIAGVAHEINNPNSFILLNAPLVRDVWEDIRPILEEYHRDKGDFPIGQMTYSTCGDSITTLLSDIEQGARRIKSIVGGLKDFSRQDENALDQDVDLTAMVRQALTLTENRLKKTTERLTLDLPEGIPTFKGHRQRVEQVIINLILNACDALTSAQNAIDIAVKTLPNREGVRLLVHDEGQGIAAEMLERIRDPFFTTKRDQGGTGLGLSICDGILRDHGGVLSIRSEPGKGTWVTADFPLTPGGFQRDDKDQTNEAATTESSNEGP